MAAVKESLIRGSWIKDGEAVKRFISAALAMMFLFCSCQKNSYDDFSFPPKTDASLVMVDDGRTGSDYRGIMPLTEKTEAIYPSEDGSCNIEKRAHYLEVSIDTDKSGHYGAGKAYGEALAKAVPDYAEKIEQFITEQIIDDVEEEICIYGNYLDIDEKYIQELHGFADSFGVSEGFSEDGIISFEEALFLSTINDSLFLFFRNSALSVNGEKSASGRPVVCAVSELQSLEKRELSELHTVLHIKSGNETVTMFTVAGLFTGMTAVNSRGLGAVMSPLWNKSTDAEKKNSALYAVREALEKYGTAREAGKFMGKFRNFARPVSVMLTDCEESLCAEHDGGKNVIRDCGTEISDELKWEHPDCMLQVNSAVSKEIMGEELISVTNYSRCEKINEWLKEYEKLDIDGMKSMMTCEKINNYSIDVNVRTCNTFEMIVMDSESGEIQAVFSDDEAMDDIPEFISIRSK